MKPILLKLGLPALVIFTFFFLLGNRPLNEPDEGRYTEIAREMIETGNWLVPHFWYLPHLDKPPMTYWLVAISMKIFGQSEWSARLPVALAGISGVWAAYLLGCALGARRVGIWSALILMSTAFYFIMGRMLTTDMLLTQFTAWAIYFLWRSWRTLRDLPMKDLPVEQEFAPGSLSDGSPSPRPSPAGRGRMILRQFESVDDRSTSGEDTSASPGVGRMIRFFAWHFAGWIAVALAFLTKGPIALAIPVVSLLALIIFRRKEIPGVLFAGIIAGLALFLAVAAPWFLVVFQRVPQSAHYMILGQAAGHLLGTTIKNRTGIPGYYFPVLAGELLPWTLLLGWLWRRAHWRTLDPKAKEAWLLLNVWAIFTFTLFSCSHAKLPAYVLPIFPALAVLLAWRFFGSPDLAGKMSAPLRVWRISLAISFLSPAIFPLIVCFILHDKPPLWLICQGPLAAAFLILIFISSQKWDRQRIAGFTVGLALAGFYVIFAELPLFPINLKANQTLDQIGLALRKNFAPGDEIICWGRLPQGLPFYATGLISETKRPYFGAMDLKQVPFEFPGNLERLGSLYLPDDNALAKLLHENHGDLIVGFGSAIDNFEKKHGDISLRRLAQSGKWTVYSK